MPVTRSFMTMACAALLCVSCAAPRPDRAAQDCPAPPPPPPCAPTSFTTVLFDTSSARFPHWKISIVDGASGNGQQWGLMPAGRTATLLVDGDNAGLATYHTVTRTSVTSVDTVRASAAAPVMLTCVLPDRIMGDAAIHPATISNGTVTFGEPLGRPVNLDVYWDGHPVVVPASAQGSGIMVFASDRPGSYGGTDLWYTVRNGDAWSEPVNLGPAVNTPCDELSPSFTSDGRKMLFASAGHATAGGYDIFQAAVEHPRKDSIALSDVRNIGLPVNTAADELFPWMPSDSILYYGSSQRSGDFDVYVLHRVDRTMERRVKKDTLKDDRKKPEDIARREELAKKPRTTIKGRVVNEKTSEPVVDAEVTARDEASKQVLSSTRTDTAGDYTLSVPTDTPVEVSAQSGKLFYDRTVTTIPKEQANDTVRMEKPLHLPITLFLRVNFPTAIFDAPYQNTLDSNGTETSQTWQSALDMLVRNIELSGDQLQRLILIGHTDDVDTDVNNLKLGRQRVDFIIDQLVQRGVDRSLLEGRSAGERLKPDKRKGESLDQWRKRSRRVELVKILR